MSLVDVWTGYYLDCVVLAQDAHHREAMGSLQVAERSSLLSEIQQLRGQLEQLHQSKSDDKHLNIFTAGCDKKKYILFKSAEKQTNKEVYTVLD